MPTRKGKETIMGYYRSKDLFDKNEKAAKEVMKTWEGTPEELGQDLYVATMTIDPPGWTKEDRQRWHDAREKQSQARARIMAHNDGHILIHTQQMIYCIV